MKQFKLQTFLFLALFIVLATIAFVLFSSLLLAASVVGAIMYLIAWIRVKFFMKPVKIDQTKKKPVIYEHGEY